MSSAGCSDSDKNSSSKKDSDTAKTSSVSSIVESESIDEESSLADDSSKVVNEQGELIQKAAEFFRKDTYSFKVKYTSTDGSVTDITRAVSGDNIYQLQENDIGTGGFIRVDGQSYEFDNVCGIYRKSEATSLDSIVLSVVDENLPMTDAHIDGEDAEKYDVEEYTYAGDVFITVLDFYFSKEDGTLVKYVSTYSVEGDDDISEVREIYDMSDTADESLFDAEKATSLSDFDNMTEDQRLGYCQGICATAGVTTDEMYEFGTDTDKLKTISYDDFVSLVYAYGYNNQ